MFPVLLVISFSGYLILKIFQQSLKLYIHPSLPNFANEIRVVVGEDVDDVIKFLDEEE